MSPDLVNAVYYPSWKVYKGCPPSCLDVRSVTHIFYAFLLDEFGDLKKEVDGEAGCLRALAKLKRNHRHLKTVVSLGGGSGSAEFPKLAAGEESRTTFAKEARKFCDLYDFDGIDIDWEHPSTSGEGENFVRLIEAAREELPHTRYILSAALPVGQYTLKHIDLGAAGRVLDHLNLMGYDFMGAWTDVSGHQAQLLPPSDNPDEVYPTLRKSVSGGVDYITSRGFPAHKIVVGIPAYGRFFPEATGPGQPFSARAGEVDYRDMADEWVANAAVDCRAAVASFVDSECERGFVSFDVPKTVEAKARYVRANGLGGLFYWTGVSDRGGDDSLVSAGFKALRQDKEEL
ncbi:chitinase [Geosmithia morbida]|uniref:chitinase n=1 Tax=Geosmithia morbida TaxID=1094350 RepID=A0A9P4YRK5_9HYPO|nr:chitinase [Geosmithia morbida]KAF4119729.1 chitinase [Geosmithia morbida]